MDNKIDFIKEFQKSLKEQFKVGYQNWWSNFIFHYSNVDNICSILNSGTLYSRKKANELKVMLNDNANDDVISKTTEHHTKYARFYFGAKTPTQYSNEGIKPISEIINNAHCPVPIFLLFDFVKILSIDGVLFSTGNIAASGAIIYNDIRNLNNLEFNYIYDRNVLPNDNYKYHIMYCRQAEVLIENSLDNIFDYLKIICVRSQAEKETLLYNLHDKIKDLLKNKIVIYNNDGLFYRKYLYVNQVKIHENNNIIFEFHNADRYEYNLNIIIFNLSTKNEVINKKRTLIVPNQLSISLENEIIDINGLYIKVLIEDSIVYESNLFKDESTIF